MNRPNRVGNRQTLGAYAVAPALAESGWRLTVPGDPDGGQYHGYVGPDSTSGGWPAGTDEVGNSSAETSLSGSSVGPWDHLWSGIALNEGDSLSDYVYRSPGEVRPRANASGGSNVVRSYQRQRTAGYSVAPGNYAALGFVGDASCLAQDADFRCPGGTVMVIGAAPCYQKGCASGHGYTTGVTATEDTAVYVGDGAQINQCPQTAVVCGEGQVAVAGDAPCYTRHCVAEGSSDALSADPNAPTPLYYATAAPAEVTAANEAGTSVVTTATTTAATTTSTDSSSTSTIAGIEEWLTSSTLISSIPNMYIVGVAAIAAYFLLSSGKKKKR